MKVSIKNFTQEQNLMSALFRELLMRLKLMTEDEDMDAWAAIRYFERERSAMMDLVKGRRCSM